MTPPERTSGPVTVDRRPERLAAAARTLALASLVPAVLALAGWLGGHTVLASIDLRYVPMAPNTAFAFLALGALHGWCIPRAWSQAGCRLLAGLVTALALLRVLELSAPLDLGVDGWLLRPPDGWLGAVPLGRMALPTGLGLLAASTAALLLSAPDRSRLTNDLAKILGVASASGGLAFALGYAYGAPLFYGTSTIPMALTTALSFAGIGAAQTLSALAREHAERRDTLAALASAVSELESFNRAVSHDLRAPLRAVHGFAEALLEEHGDKLDPEARELVERIQRSAVRMSGMISGLVALTRSGHERLERRRVDLGDLAREVASELLRDEPERAIELIVAPGLAAEGDPRLLRVVLQNLLANAWKFTRREPRPCIEVGCVAADPAGATAFFVRDNGAGFDPDHAGRLFEAFQRLHPASAFEGTGLGLATVRRIVERHGGRVWAEGAVGAGATFRFTLSGSPRR